MGLGVQDVLRVLSTVQYPGFTRDIVAFGTVRDVRVENGRVSFRLEIGAGNPSVAGTIETEARAALAALAGVTSIEIRHAAPGPPAGLRMAGSAAPSPSPAATPPAGVSVLPGVRNVIAVASGKGGVGKSTVAVNLAVGLASKGAAVGLLDADIYGPSIPLMMGTRGQPRLDPEGRRIVPFERFGVRFMSLGFLVEPDSAVIWRGPMVMKAVSQLLEDVVWGDIDVLVVDMPPGTGDAQLTLSQKVRLAGAVIVTTPQDVALADAIKGVAMFRKVGVPILGIVENMSEFLCPHCGQATDVFGRGGGKREADRLEVPFLGEVPLDPLIRHQGDRGEPVVASNPDSPQAASFVTLATAVLDRLDVAPEPDDASPRRGGWLGRLRRERSRS